MKNKKLIIAFLSYFFFCNLAAQIANNEDDIFFNNIISKAPESVFKKFIDAGMSPINHELTDTEQKKLANAFLMLPPTYLKILKKHLHSISFMDNMPNTALTSPIESLDTIKKFNITFRSGILNETISEWATWKEKSLYDSTSNPLYEIQIDAGSLDAILYVLLHEATHVIDEILKLTPHTDVAQTIVLHTVYTKNIWNLYNVPVSKFINSKLENTRFRSGKVQTITAAKEIYTALEKTPFVSLYGMASWYEDIAELITIYHITKKLNQPFVIYVKENGEIKSKFEPMKNKLVKKRLKQLDVFYD